MFNATRLIRHSRVLALVACCGLAQAAVPPTLVSYQGQLSNGGLPANGTFNMTFRLFNAAGAGSELLVDTKSGINAVTVTNGLFTTTLGAGVVTDGSGAGSYTDLAQVMKDFSAVWVQVEVNGTPLLPRQRLISAPFALNATRAETLDNVTIADGSTWTVAGSPSNLNIDGVNLQVQVGDSIADQLIVYSQLFMLPAGIADVDQNIYFSNGGVQTGEAFAWDESDDRFELTDSLAMTGPLVVGSITTDATQLYSRFGIGTPVSLGMNSVNDVLVTDDIECLSSIIASGNILMRANGAEGDASIFFREDASDVGEFIRWDDSADKFLLSDALEIQGNFTVSDPDGAADVQSTGGITIRIDTDNNDSGPNAGVFSINANAPDIFGTPLLRLQSTDEANLELDNGVVTDAFDFAEAFRATQGQEDLEPGDVVTIATGANQHEHCEKTDEANERVILGVVSTNPAYTAGMSFEAIELADPALTAQRNAARERGDHAEANRLDKLMDTKMREQWKPIAMVGRVPTKVDATFGAIKAGDYLTSSPTPGYAMKMTGPGMALGVALEDFDSEKGTISVFVRPTWHGAPNAQAVDAGRVAAIERENASLKSRLEAIEQMLAAKVAER
ncbi:MAG: hypothetical protein ACOYN0_07200 [Phycisphaerales bacterium]